MTAPSTNRAPGPIDTGRLALDLTAAATALVAVRKSICDLIGQGHAGVTGSRSAARIVQGGALLTAALDDLALALAPDRPDGHGHGPGAAPPF
jgi:hypothetical protein